MDEVLRASHCLFWSWREIRGHGYLIGEELALLVHSELTTPRMIELLDAWKLGHAEDDTRRTGWDAPGSDWHFHCDAGAWERALAGRSVVAKQLLGSAPDGMPIDFLRAPVHRIVQALLGDVAWPAHLNAEVLRPRFQHARRDDALALSACRYGSRHADAGQDRTAAVFVSRDAGASWEELSWTLPLRQRLTRWGSWPPEQIDRLALDAVAAPVIEFEDPWIAFEPGTEWSARWLPDRRYWLMEVR